MRFGTRTPNGFLPVFSVADEQEARALLVRACGTNYQGEFVARELVEEQTLDHLDEFSDRLASVHDMLVGIGKCRCRTAHQGDTP